MAARLGDAAAAPASWYNSEGADVDGIDMEDVGVPRVNINSEVAVSARPCFSLDAAPEQNAWLIADCKPIAKRWYCKPFRRCLRTHGSHHRSKAKV